MVAFFDRIRGLGAVKQPARPYSEQGTGGYMVSGGVIVSPETNPSIAGQNRWRVASDMLANTSIVAAGLRYFLNLTARPAWQVEPAIEDNAEAEAMAEFVEDVLHDTDTSWARIVRRAAMYRFHGYGIHEWVAKKREDGRIGIASIEVRPAHTIEKWDIDPSGGVVGVIQRDPQDGHEIYLPRQKLVYLVDDTLTDRPDGLGWWRHLVDPANRIKTYLKLEGIGFQRDLTGTPIGRAPLHKLNEMVEAGAITKEQSEQMLQGIKDMVRLETKNERTGLILDSQTYIAKSENGESVSQVFEWGIELLKGDQASIDALAKAINRLDFQMASIMGVASMLTGREGEGSRALSEDQSRNLYLTVNATLAEIAEAFDRDIIGPLWAMNGFDDKLRPTLKTEDASFKDVEQIANVLAKLAQAGAIMAPDDPALDDIRDLAGISRARPMSVEELALLRGKPLDNPDDSDLEEGDKQDSQRPRRGQGRANKYDPNQPRDPGGIDGGRWISAGGGADDEIFDYRKPPDEFEGAPIIRKRIAGNQLAIGGSSGIAINTSRRASAIYKDMAAYQAKAHADGWMSSPHPNHVIWHEYAHYSIKNNYSDRDSFLTNLRASSNARFSTVASKVSRYAATNGHEFVAEVYAAKRVGIALPKDVTDYYGEVLGGKPL